MSTGIKHIHPVRSATLLVACLLVSSCVSSSLNSVKDESATGDPQQLKKPSYDLALRKEAVEEMRAKAEDKSGKKTDVFRNQDGPAQPLNKRQVEQKTNSLNATASNQSNTISDAELTAKQKSMIEMRKRLQNHYSDALKKIEN